MNDSLKIYNVKDKIEYLREVLTLEYLEWSENKTSDIEHTIDKKVEKVESMLERNDFCKLVLLNGDKLVGFISIFPEDSDEHKELTPWYATMYVKKEYRGKGYSKILNDAILKESKKRGFKTLYLKTTLNNYYEKFGAKLIEVMPNGEKLLKFDL